MRILYAAALVGLLGLNAPVWAQNPRQDEGRNRDQNRNQIAGNVQTIHGVVAGVTVAGETMINYDTDQAIVARTTYLTILGAPGRGRDHREAGGDRQRDSAGNRESARDSQKGESARNENGRSENARGENQSERGRNHWNNVYFLAVTPQTRIFMEGEEKGKGGSTPEDQARTNAAFQKIELGERVVVEFNSMGAPGGRPADAKHGRDRTFRGQATSVEILNRETRGDQRGNESSRDRSSSDKSSSEKDSSDKDKK